ncbi:MAG: type II toxin-antitoxin system VapC family toxin [bacterium]
MTPVRRRVRRSFAATPAIEPSPKRLLLDTHVWLWWQADDARLGVETRELIQRASEVRFSAASAWEIAVKINAGKLKLPKNADIAAELAHSGFLVLPVELAHAEQMRHLPVLHRDPFDRLLVAQARVEELTLVTVDRALSAYDVAVLDATL